MSKSKKNVKLHAPTIQLKIGEDGQAEKNIQILRVGKWKHPWYGTINITKKKLKDMVRNFKNDVVRNELMLDFNHEVNEAAGWFREVFTDNDGTELWASINYTRKGKSSIEENEWKYISADFTENFKCPETEKEHGPTLYGAALTNRPFIKAMAKVALSEEQMEEQMEEEIKELQTAVADLTKLVGGIANQLSEIKNKEPAKPEGSTDEIELSEEAQKIADENKKLKDTIAKNEKETKFNEMVRNGKAVPAQKEAFMADDMVKFAELAKETKTDSEGHDGGGEDHQFDDAQDEVMKLAEEKMVKKSMDFDAALHEVMKERPELKAKVYDEN